MIKCACAILSSVAAWLYIIFPHYLVKGTNLKKNIILHTIYMFWFSLQILSETSHSKRKWNWYYHKYAYVFIFMYSTCYSCQILTKFEFSWQIFEKYSKIEFHENPSIGSRVVPYWQTDRQDEANDRFFCDFPNVPKTSLKVVTFEWKTCRRHTLNSWLTLWLVNTQGAVVVGGTLLWRQV